MDELSHLRLRRAARALILDNDDAVLLVGFNTPERTVWAPPGGGIEDGETVIEGLRRELVEEVGRDDLDIGPLVYVRTAIFPVSSHFDGQVNDVHLVRAERFDPEPGLGWEAMHAEGVGDMRWWTVDEIDAAVAANAPDVFVPAEITDVIRSIAEHGPPDEPWEFTGHAFDRPPLAAVLSLEPHPEGGWYRETWRSDTTVTLPDGRVRPTATAIYFLLPAGETSTWHRVRSDEMWLVHQGWVVLELGGTGDAPTTPGTVINIGMDCPPQGLVPAGTWQRTVATDVDALVSCVVSPGFDFDDFELADR